MRKLLIVSVALAAAVACTGDAPMAPTVAASPEALLSQASGLPGWKRTQDAEAGKFIPVNCSPKHASSGSAEIGPAGGILNIGTHRLIIPAGALTKKVLISGTVPEGKPFQVDLQPHGLQFKKAAGLILDASSCINVPTIVYLIDQVQASDPIPAIYSNWWKAIACPIWHFSGYGIAFQSEEDGSSAE